MYYLENLIIYWDHEIKNLTKSFLLCTNIRFVSDCCQVCVALRTSNFVYIHDHDYRYYRWWPVWSLMMLTVPMKPNEVLNSNNNECSYSYSKIVCVHVCVCVCVCVFVCVCVCRVAVTVAIYLSCRLDLGSSMLSTIKGRTFRGSPFNYMYRLKLHPYSQVGDTCYPLMVTTKFLTTMCMISLGENQVVLQWIYL